MSRRPGIRGRGFALIDTIVVTCVATFALMLATPAVQQARERARRTVCKNNLKQIGIACHNYHDVYNCFPAAWYARYYEADSRSWTGWQTSLLPYLEQAPLYQQVTSFGGRRGSRSPEWPDDASLTVKPVGTYRCPTDTTGDTNVFRGGFATSSYSGNAGSTPYPRIYAGMAEQYWPGGMHAVTDFGGRPRSHQAGIFAVNSRTGIRDITDGTSNTLMVTERSAISGAGLWMGVRSNRTDNDVVTEFSHLSRINKSLTGASSFHQGGAQFLLCDGSVRFLSEDLASGPATEPQNIQPLQALAGRSDGTVVGEF